MKYSESKREKNVTLEILDEGGDWRGKKSCKSVILSL